MNTTQKINAVLVGPSGLGRKGTSWSEASYILRKVDESFQKIIVSGLSSGEGLIHHLRDDPNDEEAESKEKRAFVQEAEFSRVLKVSRREGSILSEVIRDAFDRDSFSVLTKNPVRATNVHVSIVGHITEHELKKHLDDTSKANGLGNRFLWIHTHKTKSLPFGGKVEETELERPVAAMKKALERQRGQIIVFDLSSDASSRWLEVYDALVPNASDFVDSLLSRATSHVMRVACVYAVLDCSDVIELSHLNAALAVWNYSRDSVLFIFGDRVGYDDEKKIMNELVKKTGISRTEISSLFRGHRNKREIDNMLQNLLAWGLIEVRNEGSGPSMKEVIYEKLRSDAK